VFSKPLLKIEGLLSKELFAGYPSETSYFRAESLIS
jgi:hypothetical protein